MFPKKFWLLFILLLIVPFLAGIVICCYPSSYAGDLLFMIISTTLLWFLFFAVESFSDNIDTTVVEEKTLMVLTDWGYLVGNLTTLLFFTIVGLGTMIFFIKVRYYRSGNICFALIVWLPILFYKLKKSWNNPKTAFLVVKKDGTVISYRNKKRVVLLDNQKNLRPCYCIISKTFLDIWFTNPIFAWKMWKILQKKKALTLGGLCLLISLPIILIYSFFKTLSLLIIKMKFKFNEKKYIAILYIEKDAVPDFFSIEANPPPIMFLSHKEKETIFNTLKCKVKML